MPKILTFIPRTKKELNKTIELFKKIRREKRRIIMDNQKFIEKCKELVMEYTNNHMDKSDKKEISVEDVFVVWSCKTLQNSKALLSTTVSDGMYYECTLNGDKKEIYFDAYKKWENKAISVAE